MFELLEDKYSIIIQHILTKQTHGYVDWREFRGKLSELWIQKLYFNSMFLKKGDLDFNLFIVFVSHTSAWILKVRKRVWCKIHMTSYIKCIGKIIMGKSNWTETLFKTWKQ